MRTVATCGGLLLLLLMYWLKSIFGYGALSLVFGLLQSLGGLIVYRLLRAKK